MGCCRTLTAIMRDCDSNTGGIRRAWIACYDNVTAPTITDEVISALGTPASEFVEFEFRPETGSITDTITKDNTAGTLFYETAIVLQFARRETVKRIAVSAIAVSDMVVIIEDENGLYWYFGLSRPVRLSEGTEESGTAWTDFNGYNITLQAVENEMPYEISAAAMAPILNPTAP